MKNGLFVHAQEEGPGFHAFCFEFLRELDGVQAGAFIEDKAIHPIHLPGPGLFHGQLEAGDALEAFRVGLPHPAFPGDDLGHALQLAKADGRLQVGEAEVVAELGVIEAAMRKEAEIAQASCLLGICGVIGEDHAAFAGRDELVGVKAEDADVG